MTKRPREEEINADELVELTDYLLLEITQYLSRKDWLPFLLSCKRFYAIGISRGSAMFPTNNALIQACKHNLLDSVRYLLTFSHIDPSAAGNKAIWIASYFKHQEILALLYQDRRTHFLFNNLVQGFLNTSPAIVSYLNQ